MFFFLVVITLAHIGQFSWKPFATLRWRLHVTCLLQIIRASKSNYAFASVKFVALSVHLRNAQFYFSYASVSSKLHFFLRQVPFLLCQQQRQQL